VRLVTWNVNSLRVRLPRVLELLELHAPDTVCLQETKVESGAFPHEELAAAGYAAIDHSAGRWAGVAVLARGSSPPSDPAIGLPGEALPEEARWVEATVAGVRVVSVYVPNGRAVGSEAFVHKLAFLRAAARRASELRGQPLVIAGDWNVAPADLDVYDPAAFAGSTHVTAEERALLVAVEEEGGLLDAYRRLHPDEVGYTWWDYRQGHFHRKMGLRIDLALVSGDLAVGLGSCGIDRNFRKGPKPSDHAPLLLDIDR
jgi:exodeoxyribonuclease-3